MKSLVDPRTLGATLAAGMLSFVGCNPGEIPIGGGDGSATDGAAADAATLKDAGSMVCPAELPQGGTVCLTGLYCQYGDNPNCLSDAECPNGTWLVSPAKCAPIDPSCPATREVAAGQTCTTAGGYCSYSGLLCTCTNCIKYPVSSCSGALTWHCDAPNTTPGCPAARPNLGTPCNAEGLFCAYGCEQDVSRSCQGGMWEKATAPYGCPVSTRAAKREIHYLDGDELTRVAARAAGLRLATYRYLDPALGGRRRLGYILEDSPESPSSDLERREVDLYSYSSMALALAQDQRRELRAMQSQIAALRAELRDRCDRQPTGRVGDPARPRLPVDRQRRWECVSCRYQVPVTARTVLACDAGRQREPREEESQVTADTRRAGASTFQGTIVG